MYGLSPDRGSLGDATASFGLVPAMTLTSKLVQVKKAPKGSSVGYGGTAVLEEDTYIGVVMLGYADGIPRVRSCATTGRLHLISVASASTVASSSSVRPTRFASLSSAMARGASDAE